MKTLIAFAFAHDNSGSVYLDRDYAKTQMEQESGFFPQTIEAEPTDDEFKSEFGKLFVGDVVHINGAGKCKVLSIISDSIES